MSSELQSVVAQKIKTKRILNNVKEVLNSKEYRAVLAVPNDINTIWVCFEGLKGFYREKYVIEIKLATKDLTRNYPLTPPNVKFLTPILHTNVSGQSICVSILHGKSDTNPLGWTEACNLAGVVQAILTLLEEPNVDSAFNTEASEKWIECNNGKDIDKYIKYVNEYYMQSNYKTAIDAFEKRYTEGSFI
jgi:ubiquitin-conjugating enzyme E2 G2